MRVDGDLSLCTSGCHLMRLAGEGRRASGIGRRIKCVGPYRTTALIKVRPGYRCVDNDGGGKSGRGVEIRNPYRERDSAGWQQSGSSLMRPAGDRGLSQLFQSKLAYCESKKKKQGKKKALFTPTRISRQGKRVCIVRWSTIRVAFSDYKKLRK